MLNFIKGEIVEVKSDHLIDAPETATVFLVNEFSEIAGLQFETPLGYRTDGGIAITNLLAVIPKETWYEDLFGNKLEIAKLKN